MKKTTFFLLLSTIILLASFVYAQEDVPLITVMDFKASGISEAEVEVFVDYISSHILESGKYRVLDRMQRESILQELEFSLSGCTDENCQLEAGRLLQARQIIIGSLGKVGNRFLLNIKLIDVETGETIRTKSEKYSDIDTLIDESKDLVYEFIELDSYASDREEGIAGLSLEVNQSIIIKKTLLRGNFYVFNGIEYKPRYKDGYSPYLAAVGQSTNINSNLLENVSSLASDYAAYYSQIKKLMNWTLGLELGGSAVFVLGGFTQIPIFYLGGAIAVASSLIPTIILITKIGETNRFSKLIEEMTQQINNSFQ